MSSKPLAKISLTLSILMLVSAIGFAAWRAAESAMSPVCTNATRTVGPTAGAGPSRNHKGPSPTHTSAHPSATSRPVVSRCAITPAIAVFAAARRKLVNHTPPSAAEASVTG